MVGWSSKLEPPKFSRDDSNVSKRSTPEQKGARGCRHCGSMKHWDNECRYSKSGTRRARSNFVALTTKGIEAQQAYDALCYDTDSETDEESNDKAHTNFTAISTKSDSTPVQEQPEDSEQNRLEDAHCNLA